ncbi:MAG: hypothetical protein CUN56_10400, partial [Phototrophicales bacterium]
MLGRLFHPIRWITRFVIFQLLPVIILAATLWSGYQVAQAFMRHFDERQTYEARRADFPGTATAIALAVDTATFTPSPTDEPTVTSTLTASPEPTATHTLTHTPTDEPTQTPLPVLSPAPTDTPIVLSPVPSDTSTPGAISGAFQFVTNTPRPVVFATNTPEGADVISSTPTPQPTNTPLPTATDAPIATSTPFLTNTPIPTSEPATPTPAAEIGPLPTLLFPREVEPGTVINGFEVPTRVPQLQRDYNLVNIILLGSDGELVDDGLFRTDTMIIVSVNRDTGTVNMLSLPRDLYVYIPLQNGMMQRLNVVYGVGENIGYTDGGFGLLRQTIFYNFGINVHYYALVNFTGFKDVIDFLGGVDIAVDCAYEDDQLIGTELPEGVVEVEEGRYILPVGYYQMDGAQALWYVRTRKSSSDFDRGRRQQQVLRAIWRRSLSMVNLTNAVDLWNQGMSVIETNMNVNDFLGLLPLALNLDVSRIESFTMIPTYHTTSYTAPDGASVQLPVYDTLQPFLQDFYRPPSENQLLVLGASVMVYNGTENADWDIVAADRLQWEGFRAVAAGSAESVDYTDTVLIDYTGQQKGSSRDEIAY